MRKSLTVLFFSSACGGQALDVGYDDYQVDNPDLSAAVDVSAVRARCAAAGTAEPYTADAASRALLAGRWFLCDSSGDAGMDLPPAFQFDSLGNWSALVPDGSGLYLADPAHRGTFHTGKVISCCYPDTWLLTLTTPSNTAAPSFLVEFRRGPLQMSWAKSTDGNAPRPTVAHFVKG
jgi:hypothetical protein